MAEVPSAVVLLSGGLDSSVLLHLVAREQCAGPVHALSFDYGQRHARELASARAQAEAAGCIAHVILPLTFFGPLVAGATTLVDGGGAVPDLKDLDADTLRQPPTYVPNRNMMLLSLAAAYAEAHGIRDVFYGAQAQDEYGYWDCTREFLAAINGVLRLNRGNAVTVHAPLVAASKAENVRLGVRLGVDFAQTWSCYRGGERPCGTCPTCVERDNAFRAEGIADPLLA